MGGFLTGGLHLWRGRTVRPLLTRDAILPLVAALAAAKENGKPVSALVAGLPARAKATGRLADIDTHRSKAWIERLVASPGMLPLLRETQNIQTVDGAKFVLADGNSLHLRLSGNAPELRLYVETSNPCCTAPAARCDSRGPDGTDVKLFHYPFSAIVAPNFRRPPEYVLNALWQTKGATMREPIKLILTAGREAERPIIHKIPHWQSEAERLAADLMRQQMHGLSTRATSAAASVLIDVVNEEREAFRQSLIEPIRRRGSRMWRGRAMKCSPPFAASKQMQIRRGSGC